MAFAQLVDSRPRGPVLSPTQVETYDLCKRKWAFKYIAKLPDPQKPSAKLGTAVHDVLERWLRSAVPPDMRTHEGRIAARMIKHLPPPGVPHSECERTFYLVTKNGVAWTGKIDWSGVWEGWPTVIDHKTTGNPIHVKSEAQLHSDPQALIYAVAGGLGFGTDQMQLMWGYGTTKDRDAQTFPVKTKLRLPVVIEKFDRILDPFAMEIAQIDRGNFHPGSAEGIAYAKLFPATPTACSAFGGCVFQNVCNLSEAERLGAFMNMPAPPPSLASRLAHIPPVPGAGGFAPPLPAQAGGIPPVPSLPTQGFPSGVPPLPAAPPALSATQGFAPPPAPGVPPLPAAPALPATQGFAPPGAPPAAPPALPQMPAAPGAPTQTGFAFSPPGAVPYPPTQGPNPPEAGRAAPQAVDASGNGAEAPKGRGRPRGSKNKDGATTEAMRDASAGSPVLAERIAFAIGASMIMQRPDFNGQLDQMIYGGQMAVAALKAQYPSG